MVTESRLVTTDRQQCSGRKSFPFPRRLLEVKEMFIIWVMVMVSWMYAYIKIGISVHVIQCVTLLSIGVAYCQTIKSLQW